MKNKKKEPSLILYDNSSLLSIIAAALVSGQVDLSALKLPGQDTPDKPDEAPQIADVPEEKTAPTPEMEMYATETDIQRKTGKAFTKAYSAPQNLQSFYEWLTGSLEGRFRYKCILEVGRRIKFTRDFPMSADLLTNCRRFLAMDPTAEELEGFVRAWMTYDSYMARWRNGARKAQCWK